MNQDQNNQKNIDNLNEQVVDGKNVMGGGFGDAIVEAGGGPGGIDNWEAPGFTPVQDPEFTGVHDPIPGGDPMPPGDPLSGFGDDPLHGMGPIDPHHGGH